MSLLHAHALRDKVNAARLGVALAGLCVALACWAVWRWGTEPFQDRHFGDDQEYLTMTSSFVRHGSPDFRPGDDTAMLEQLPRRWRRTLARKFFPDRPPYAYYQARDGRWYGYHFFTYSAVVAPLRAWLDGTPNASRAHQYTNLAWYCAALLSLLQVAPRPRVFWPLLVLVTISPVLWFLTYAHTETFVLSLGVIGLACQLAGRPRWAIFWTSLAATQYQPVALVPLVLVIHYAHTLRRDATTRPARWRALAELASALALASLVLVPSVFYFVNFGSPNLIAREGYAQWKLLSFHKFAWMFLDPNGGMFAYLPGLTLLVLWATGAALARAARERDGWGLALLGCALATMFAATCQRNWNHPTFGISRYVVYAIAPLLLFVGHELARARLRAPLLAALVLIAAALQAIPLRRDGVFAYTGNDAAHHSSLALWVLERWPALYEPPADIFCERTNPDCKIDAEGMPRAEFYPVVWRDSSGRPRKILAQSCDPDPVLRAEPWSSREAEAIRKRLAGCREPGPVYLTL